MSSISNPMEQIKYNIRIILPFLIFDKLKLKFFNSDSFIENRNNKKMGKQNKAIFTHVLNSLLCPLGNIFPALNIIINCIK